MRKAYRGNHLPIVRPSQVERWVSSVWKGYPTIAVTGPDGVPVTPCFARHFTGSRQEWEVTKRLTEWVALPPTDDDGELVIHWDEVPEELKRWV